MAQVIIADMQIREDVLAELDWDPEIDAPGVGVAVEGGVVTLTGWVTSLATKRAIGRAVQRVEGVRAVANDISVRGERTLTDGDIARVAVDALRANTLVPFEQITVTVANGKIRLDGQVTWDYQRRAAEQAVEDIVGVRGVTNWLRVDQPLACESEIRHGIEQALMRNATTDASRIHVSVFHGHVTLTGTVHSWAEKREAADAAWRAPGVEAVTNNLEVSG